MVMSIPALKDWHAWSISMKENVTQSEDLLFCHLPRLKKVLETVLSEHTLPLLG